MSFLNPDINSLIALINRGGVSYSPTMIPLTAAAYPILNRHLTVAESDYLKRRARVQRRMKRRNKRNKRNSKRRFRRKK